MNRTPPVAVRRHLRKEVGFGCPVDDCGNPYLTWHHFDPPWHERKHHNPEGMVALCQEHHSKADAGAYTPDQLRDFKRVKSPQVSGRFDWMRNRLLTILGGNFYYEVPILFEFRGHPVVWFRQDDRGTLLLNLRMLTTAREPRLVVEDNDWVSLGTPADLECPPSGRLISVRYDNGDSLRVEFSEAEDCHSLSQEYPDARICEWPVAFPITTVKVWMSVSGTELSFSPTATTLPGRNVLQNSFFQRGRVALSYGS